VYQIYLAAKRETVRPTQCLWLRGLALRALGQRISFRQNREMDRPKKES